MNKTKIASFIIFSFLGFTQIAYAKDSIDDILKNSVITIDKPAVEAKPDFVNKGTHESAKMPALPKSVETDKYQGMIVNRSQDNQTPVSDLEVLKYSPLATTRPDFAKRLYVLNKDVVLKVLSKATAFATGPVQGDAKTIYVFFDPQCPHCSNLWKETQKPELKDIQFIWIPVGYMNELSQPQGATILLSNDPVETMKKHEGILSSDQKGITPDSKVSKNIIDRIKINTLLFANLDVSNDEKAKDDFQVPLMLHMTKAGQISFVEGEVPADKIQTFINE